MGQHGPEWVRTGQNGSDSFGNVKKNKKKSSKNNELFRMFRVSLVLSAAFKCASSVRSAGVCHVCASVLSSVKVCQAKFRCISCVCKRLSRVCKCVSAVFTGFQTTSCANITKQN